MVSRMAAFDFGQYDKENDKPVRRGATCLNPSLLEAETGALNFTFKAILSYGINFQACLGEVAKILPKNKRKQKRGQKECSSVVMHLPSTLKTQINPKFNDKTKGEGGGGRGRK